MALIFSEFNGGAGAVDRLMRSSFALACGEAKLAALWNECRVHMPDEESVAEVDSSHNGRLDTLTRGDVSDAMALMLTGGVHRWPLNMTRPEDVLVIRAAMLKGLVERGYPIDHLES